MNDTELLKKQLLSMLDKAQRSLRAAKKHFRDSDYDFASSKAYYAVFHAMQAALLTKGLTFSKHAGVISGFSQHFLRTGVFPKAFSKAIQKLRKDRETGDYAYLSLLAERKLRKTSKARTRS